MRYYSLTPRVLQGAGTTARQDVSMQCVALQLAPGASNTSHNTPSQHRARSWHIDAQLASQTASLGTAWGLRDRCIPDCAFTSSVPDSCAWNIKRVGNKGKDLGNHRAADSPGECRSPVVMGSSFPSPGMSPEQAPLQQLQRNRQSVRGLGGRFADIVDFGRRDQVRRTSWFRHTDRFDNLAEI